MNESKIFLLVGPSGVGKDTLKNGSKIIVKEKVCFPQRTITRPKSKEEDNEYVTIEEFEKLDQKGEFIFKWKAHLLFYGIRKEHFENAIKKKQNIVLNVSRDIIEEIQTKYKNVYILEITCSQNIIRERLLKRGRESKEEIEERINRNVFLMEKVKSISKNLIILYNDTTIEEGIEKFVKIITS